MAHVGSGRLLKKPTFYEKLVVFRAYLDFGIMGKKAWTCSYSFPRVLSRLKEEE